MAKLRSAKKREDTKPAAAPQPAEQGVLPMQLKVGDRLTDETSEWEIAGTPYTSAAGKNVRVRVRRVGQPEVTEMRLWGAHQRVSVKRDER